MSSNSDDANNQPKPDETAPPRQNDPLLGDWEKKGGNLPSETRKK